MQAAAVHDRDTSIRSPVRFDETCDFADGGFTGEAMQVQPPAGRVLPAAQFTQFAAIYAWRHESRIAFEIIGFVVARAGRRRSIRRSRPDLREGSGGPYANAVVLFQRRHIGHRLVEVTLLFV